MSSIQEMFQIHWQNKHVPELTGSGSFKLRSSLGDSERATNHRLYCGDNLQVMVHLLEEYRNQIQMIYLDPPFDSDTEYKMRISLHGVSKHQPIEQVQFADSWSKDAYLQFIYERLIVCRELLREDGTIYVHCDPKRNYLIRCMMDEVFGNEQFINEIVWHYEKWTAKSVVGFQRNHDTILVYGKTNHPKFYAQKHITENLRNKYKKGYLIGGGYGPKGLVVYDPEKPIVKKKIASGKYKIHYAQMEGKPLSDVWNIPIINPMARERTGYPTQKPEELLQRMIQSSTDEGDIILDAFMGCGTALAVAQKEGRRFIGIDSNRRAIQMTTKRLLQCMPEEHFAAFGIYFDDTYNTTDNQQPWIVKCSSSHGMLMIDGQIEQSSLHRMHIHSKKYDWRWFVDAIYIDWHYNGEVFKPSVYDIPGRNALVLGTYPVPEHASDIGICIVDNWGNSIKISHQSS